MKYYYNGYSCVGWIPNADGYGGKWKRFLNDTEYKEAYAEALASFSFAKEDQ